MKTIKEGKVSKGGLNKAPSTPRPPAPKGQGIKKQRVPDWLIEMLEECKIRGYNSTG